MALVPSMFNQHLLVGLLLVLAQANGDSDTIPEEHTQIDQGVGDTNAQSALNEEGLDYKDNMKQVLEDFELSILKSESLQLNGSDDNATRQNLTEEDASSNSSQQRPKLNCLPSHHLAEEEAAVVSLVNGTELQARLAEESHPSAVNRTFPGNCSLTLFYASWCDFSAAAAPHYNALARLFPRMRMFAVDSANNHFINAQYGVISVPTLLVFHNGRPMYRFNHSEYNLEKYREFVHHLTGIQPENISLQLTPEDFKGPVPTVSVKGFNYHLLLATLFILACGLVDLSRTSACRGLVDMLRNAWREAEIQHEHED